EDREPGGGKSVSPHPGSSRSLAADPPPPGQGNRIWLFPGCLRPKGGPECPPRKACRGIGYRTKQNRMQNNFWGLPRVATADPRKFPVLVHMRFPCPPGEGEAHAAARLPSAPLLAAANCSACRAILRP